jgi:predicted glycoside hydrolase/deacetylase ChbG (UPF0249 family)
MIIITADDVGRSVADTDAAATLAALGRVTSMSVMVFMKDTQRAAALASDMPVDAGLHLNLCEPFSESGVPKALAAEHESLAAFFGSTRHAQLSYSLRLRHAFRNVCEAQVAEFERVFSRSPSHVDGHRHRHLCANMLVDLPIPYGYRVRRNLTFAPSEKGRLNRAYRRAVDAYLGTRYELTDYFFSLAQCLTGRSRPLTRVADLAKSAVVEIMTHPRNPAEFDFLAGEQFQVLDGVVSDRCGKRLTRLVDRAVAIGTILAGLSEWVLVFS